MFQQAAANFRQRSYYIFFIFFLLFIIFALHVCLYLVYDVHNKYIIYYMSPQNFKLFTLNFFKINDFQRARKFCIFGHAKPKGEKCLLPPPRRQC